MSKSEPIVQRLTYQSTIRMLKYVMAVKMPVLLRQNLNVVINFPDNYFSLIIN